MQVPLPTSLTRLNLTDPEVLFKTPDGVDEAVIRQAFDSAMAEAEALDREPSPQDRLRIVATAGRGLLANPAHLTAAIHWTQAAAPDLRDSAPLAHIRLIALWRLGDRSAVIDEAERLLSLVASGSPVRQLVHDTLKRWNIEQELPISSNDLRKRWGEPPWDLRDILYNKAMTSLPEISESVLHHIHSRTRLENCSYAEYRERFLCGMATHKNLQIIQNISNQREKDKYTENATELRRKMYEDLLKPATLQSFKPIDGNILITAAHAGAASLLGMFSIPNFNLPKSLIAQYCAPDSGTTFNVATSERGANIKFLKLIKMIKKSHRLMLIFPDGARGDHLDIEVLGTSTKMGRGAALLGYHGRASTHFIKTDWSEKNVEIKTHQGPTPEKDEDHESFELRFGDFYAKCLEDILTGPPENIGPLAHRIFLFDKTGI